MSPKAFDWFLSLFTLALAGPWVFYDSWNLFKLRHADRADPIVGDKRFGYVIGILIGLIGVIGVTKHHLG